ncbi:Glioma pathogenesis-related protein 1 [Taenia crassiceps]|uniref:Glioma pathogenesis-related protein 1 n=1 Tax=Taenia crassiceps TaxID=6207 RepID=A0ABR4Q1H2_9CEST
MSSALVLVSLVVLLSTATCQWPTNVERAHILEAHLRVRENVIPRASNMLLMRYSSAMECLAAYWASFCRFEHPNPSLYPWYRGIGQNLAIHSGFKPHLTESVCGWEGERKFFDFFNNTCSKVCGHYTQLVWANSDQVGCAMRRCDGIKPHWSNPQYLTVCQYKPGGNYIGQRPYVYGHSCSRCPKGSWCYRRQCVKHYRPEEVYPTTLIVNPNERTVPACLPPKFYSFIQYS